MSGKSAKVFSLGSWSRTKFSKKRTNLCLSIDQPTLMQSISDLTQWVSLPMYKCSRKLNISDISSEYVQFPVFQYGKRVVIITGLAFTMQQVIWFFLLWLQHAGDCICREGYCGARCEECAPGYTGYPHCVPCPCSVAGSVNDDICERCICKVLNQFDAERWFCRSFLALCRTYKKN